MNGYFRLIHEKSRTGIKLIPPTDGGKPIAAKDVTEYLSMKDIVYDRTVLYKAIEAMENEEKVVLLSNKPTLMERECYKFTMSQDYMQAYVKFYAPSIGGEEMTPQELIEDLKIKGIRFGVKQEVVAEFFKNRNYCEEILIAEGLAPVQGKDAYIEYHFNTDKKAKPTLKEDGSVDFFQLNVVQHCNKGDVLATLIPEVPGKYGMTITGERIKPFDVKKTALKYGNNIEISEDKTTLTSMVNGHVELVEDSVFVSDVLIVENVDNATGNIDYEGSVQINGNVCTNFQVKAKGNIEVKGVVEGAVLEADGNIIIARGMNGMARGTLNAGGNIIAKFLENVKAEAGGYIASESILHSTVMAGTEINVDGKRGFITGGKASAVNCINVKTLGSSMGADTVVEVGTDPNLAVKIQELQQKIEEEEKSLQPIQQILVTTKQKIAKGVKMTPEQLQYIKTLTDANQVKTANLKSYAEEVETLQKQMKGKEGAAVIVRGSVYPGTRICIGDVSMTVQKSAQYCRFIKSRGDVKLTGI
ncbi:MAG: FapA family protein [Blautia sp.]|nr:FapA family protein [Lachnoclostridium sp.]MCM1210976.1 FapA family protein [Blautia sp.]